MSLQDVSCSQHLVCLRAGEGGHDDSGLGSVNNCLDWRPFEVALDEDGASILTHLGHTFTTVAKAACVKLANEFVARRIQLAPLPSLDLLFSIRVNEGRS